MGVEFRNSRESEASKRAEAVFLRSNRYFITHGWFQDTGNRPARSAVTFLVPGERADSNELLKML
jgi:hypothetical protein